MKKGNFKSLLLASNSWDSESPPKAADDSSSSSKTSFRTEPPSNFQIGTDALPEKSLLITNDTFINSYDVPALSKNYIDLR